MQQSAALVATDMSGSGQNAAVQNTPVMLWSKLSKKFAVLGSKSVTSKRRKSNFCGKI